MIDKIDGVMFLHCWRGATYQQWFDTVISELSKFTKVSTALIINGRFDSHDWIHGWVQDKVRMTIPDKRWVGPDAIPGGVENWLVVGQTWQICCHDDFIGFNTLSKWSGNTYITPWSIYKSEYGSITQADIDTDALKWQTIENFGWKLLNDQ